MRPLCLQIGCTNLQYGEDGMCEEHTTRRSDAPRVVTFDDLHVGQHIVYISCFGEVKDGRVSGVATGGQGHDDTITVGNGVGLTRRFWELGGQVITLPDPQPPVKVRRVDYDALVEACPPEGYADPGDVPWYTHIHSLVRALIDNAEVAD